MIRSHLRLTILVGIASALLFTLLALARPAALMTLELFLYDMETNLSAHPGEVPNPVVLVEIDEKSNRKLGPWPWSRQSLAEMVTLLGNGGAKVIGLRLPLFEKEPHPERKEMRAFREKFNAFSFSKKDDELRSWVLENLRKMGEYLDSDRTLVESAKLAGNVILPVYITSARAGAEVSEENDLVLMKDTIASGGAISPGQRAVNIAAPYGELAQAALGVGHAGLSLKKGMEGRSHPLFIAYKGRLLPSFPLRAAVAFLGGGVDRLSMEESRAGIQNSFVPLWEGEALVDFRKSPGPPSRYSFGELLQDRKVPAAVSGKIVLIGFNLDDSPKVATPLSSMPLIEYDAHVIQALLAGQFIHRPPYMIAIELAATWIVALLAVFLFVRSGRGRRLMGMSGLFVLVLGIGFFLFSRGLWMKTGLTASQIVVIYSALSVSLLVAGRRASVECEVNRQVGIGLQGQGLLDQALEKYGKLPLDRNARDLIYRLGLDYESRGMSEKALGVYEMVQRDGKYGDLEDRMNRLRTGLSSSASEDQPGGEKGAEGDEAGKGEIIISVARYEVIQKLGKGSMGLVYKARDPRINRLLAIKTIRFSDEFDPEIVQDVKARFLREAEIAGRLSHPAIVTIYDVGEDQDLTYMAMEYLEGVDLEKFVTRDNLLPLRRVLEVVASVADALEYAHKAGVIHRDIKPANIMLLDQGGVKVTDFGIAKAVSSSRTRTGVILGTPNYMSPEQIMGQRIDYRTDIFSLGVLFYQSVTGELPFHGSNLSTLLYQITQVKHTPAKQLAPKLPRACEQIIDKALAKDPNDRFGSAGDMGRLSRLIISKMDQLKRPLSA